MGGEPALSEAGYLDWPLIVKHFEKELLTQSKLCGHTIIDNETYRAMYVGGQPINLVGVGMRKVPGQTKLVQDHWADH